MLEDRRASGRGATHLDKVALGGEKLGGQQQLPHVARSLRFRQTLVACSR
jgi:hypothetical protein